MSPLFTIRKTAAGYVVAEMATCLTLDAAEELLCELCDAEPTPTPMTLIHFHGKAPHVVAWEQLTEIAA